MIKYKGTGIYRVYSDIWLDVIKRGSEEHIEAIIEDNRLKVKVILPNLLAVKRLNDKLTELINMNKSYFKQVSD